MIYNSRNFVYTNTTIGINYWCGDICKGDISCF